ncbi:MAG: tetratricopeptide repeat protein [Rhizobiaceae bacterium]
MAIIFTGASNFAHSQTTLPDTKTSKADDIKKPRQLDLAYGAFQRGRYLTAFELALPRANLGDPAAQTLIAELYDKGLGIARDRKESTAWYEIAAKAGNREAQFSFAVKLLNGKYIKKDHDRAMKLMEQAANAGHSVAMFNFAQQIINKNPGSKGFAIALPYLEKSAGAGVVDAYYALSQIYASGLGQTAADPKSARFWLIRAARGGVDTAQIELAIQLAIGKGGEKNEKSAVAWFRRAAFSGNVIAQNRLARMLAQGLGVKANAAEAAKWYILARRAGHVDFWLDDFLKSISQKDRAIAMEAANHWHAR